MKLLVIMNKNAGINDNKKSANEIIKNFSALNIEHELKMVEGKNLKKTAAESLKNYDIIAAAGGDGTISSIASELIEKNIPLGVIPLGTLNHFAKDLNIPLNIHEAVIVISKMKTKRIDAGEVNGNIFINNSSIGFYPKIVRYRNIHSEILGLNKWLAMFVAFINVFGRFHVIELKLHSEKDIFKVKTPFVFIGNNKYRMDLFNLGIRTDIDKGNLSIYFPNTHSKISMFKFAFLALINKLNQAENFIIDLSEKIILDTKRKYLDVSIDGEVLRMKAPLYYSSKPNSIIVIVP